MVLLLSNSENLIAVPAIDLDNAVVLTPASYVDWATMFTANPSKTQFLLTPGDYMSWGTCIRLSKPGGTEGNPKIIRYYNPDDHDLHPVDRVGGNEALCDDFQFGNPTTTYWTVHGITTRGGAGNWLVYQGATNITFDYSLIEDKRKTENSYCIRIREATDWTIQRMVIRNFILDTPLPSDSLGISVGNIDRSVLGGMILDCEIYNVGDAIQIEDGPSYWKPVEMLIEGNDLYMDSTYHIGETNECWLENGIDLKAGSDTAESTVIRNNRIWGFRLNAGPTARGEGIVIQRYARNMIIESNIIGDCPMAIKDENWITTATTYTADYTTNTLTCVNGSGVATSHHLTTGAGPFLLSTTGTRPSPLLGDTQYWFIYLSATTFRWASSYVAAMDESAITVTDDGTPTNTFRIDTEATRTISFTGNQIYDIHDFADDDAGAVFKPITDIAWDNNYIARVDFLFDVPPSIYHDPTFTGNILIDVETIQRPEDQDPPVPYDPALNTVTTAPHGYVQYQRKRWTGTELASGAIPASAPPGAPILGAIAWRRR